RTHWSDAIQLVASDDHISEPIGAADWISGERAACAWRGGGAVAARRGWQRRVVVRCENVEIQHVHRAVIIEIALREISRRLVVVNRQHVEVLYVHGAVAIGVAGEDEEIEHNRAARCGYTSAVGDVA